MNTGSNTITKLMTPGELSELLSVSKTTINRLVGKRIIPFYKVGGSLRFERSEIMEYLKDNRIEPINM